MKLIMESWKRFLKEEVLEEAAVENIDDQGLMVYPSLDDPQYIILYNPLIAKPLLRGLDFDKIERIHNGVLELRFNSKHNALEVEQIWAKSGLGPTLYRIAAQLAAQAGATGIMPTAIRGQVSDEAKNVWSNFNDGVGSSYLEVTQYDGRHDEEYLNSIYSLKDGSGTISLNKALANNDRVLAADRYGEYQTAILETADTVLRGAMSQIYGDRY